MFTVEGKRIGGVMLLGATREYIRNEDESPVFLKYVTLTDKPKMHSNCKYLSTSERIPSQAVLVDLGRGMRMNTTPGDRGVWTMTYARP